MSFKQYLLEFGDLNTLSDQGIELRPYNDGNTGIEARFGDGYRVFFQNMAMKVKIGNEYVTVVSSDKCYDVNFSKNNSFHQTHEGSPFKVYRQMFAVIKKFMQEYKPYGLHISGWTPEMNLLYDKFYRAFLSNNFIRLDTSNLVEKTYFNSLPQETKDKLTAFANQENSYHSKYLQAVRDRKQSNREYDKKINSLQNT